MAAIASHSQDIQLHVGGKVYKVNKKVLCQHSDYFSAMFSGKYVENEKNSISIDVIDAKSMDIILKYIEMGKTDLNKFDLSTVGALAMASNFLQIASLSSQIKHWLDGQLSYSTWVEIMTIAEQAGFIKLEGLAGAFGLLSFKEMLPEHIPNVRKLFWYLFHPSLNTESELDVFKFGFNWVLNCETCSCAGLLLIVVGCLDVTKLNIQNLKEITLLMSDCENCLASNVLECLKMILDNKMEICIPVLESHVKALCETFTDTVYYEILKIVKYSTQRKFLLIPIVPLWKVFGKKLQYAPHFLYKFRNNYFEDFVKCASKELWGWSIASWGASKVVHVCGEFGRGTGQFMNFVRIYDALRQEWTSHGAKLPPRRHAGVTIAGDTLFVVGGVGGFRVIEDSAYTYDLKNKEWRNITNFPEAIQSPGICTHYGSVYASGYKDIYKFEDLGEINFWQNILRTDIRVNHMESFKDHIYCTQNYFSHMYRFRPGIDDKLEMVTRFSAPAVALCAMGSYLLAFTKSVGEDGEILRVEEFTGPCMCPDGTCIKAPDGCGTRIVWAQNNPGFTFNDVAGVCTIVTRLTKSPKTSVYHQKYLDRFGDITYRHK